MQNSLAGQKSFLLPNQQLQSIVYFVKKNYRLLSFANFRRCRNRCFLLSVTPNMQQNTIFLGFFLWYLPHVWHKMC